MAAISHVAVEVELQPTANQTASYLDKLYPGVKATEGMEAGFTEFSQPNIRSQVTDLVISVRQLHQETNLFLRERGSEIRLRPDLEEKLSAALGNIEVELRKIIEIGGLCHFHMGEEEGESKRSRSLFKLKFKKQLKYKDPKVTTPTSIGIQHWSTDEVASWLENLQLSEYKEVFIKHDIRGSELINLERRDLKDLGITKVGHIKRILQGIKEISVSTYPFKLPSEKASQTTLL